MSSVTRTEKQAHETARRLASESLDRRLSAGEAAWLADHLRRCPACRTVADEYRAIHDELRALPTPEPPRDLWARTSAGLDQVDRDRSRRSGRRASGGLRLGRLGLATSLLSVVAVAVVIAATGFSALSQGKPAAISPSVSGTGQIAAATTPAVTPQDAVAVMGGTTYWLAPSDGVYEIKGGSSGCNGSATSCTVTSGHSSVLGSVESKTAVSVVISPGASQAAVWNADKVVVMPLSSQQPATVSIDLLTPAPAAPTATQPAASAAATPAQTPAASTVSPASSPAESPAPESGAPETPAPSPVAGAEPTDILDGYRVVGRSPQWSPDGKWLAFSAREVGGNAGSDVFVWRMGWSKARAVSSTHVDLFAGWLGPRILISDFTTTPVPGASPASGGNVTARSYIYDPLTDSVHRISRSMLLPVVDPTGRYVVYWAGAVVFDPASGLWVAQRGDLYFDRWDSVLAYDTPDAEPGSVVAFVQSVATTQSGKPSPSGDVSPSPSPSPTADVSATPEASSSASPVESPTATPEPTPPTASLPQRLQVGKLGSVSSWVVRWDATGRSVAIWVGNGNSANSGDVKLLRVIAGSDLLDIADPLLSVVARPNISFDGQQFVYTVPGDGGNDKTYLLKLPASSAVETPTPSPAATPTPEITPSAQESAASGEPAASPSPDASPR